MPVQLVLMELRLLGIMIPILFQLLGGTPVPVLVQLGIMLLQLLL